MMTSKSKLKLTASITKLVGGYIVEGYKKEPDPNGRKPVISKYEKMAFFVILCAFIFFVASNNLMPRQWTFLPAPLSMIIRFLITCVIGYIVINIKKIILFIFSVFCFVFRLIFKIL